MLVNGVVAYTCLSVVMFEGPGRMAVYPLFRFVLSVGRLLVLVSVLGFCFYLFDRGATNSMPNIGFRAYLSGILDWMRIVTRREG